MPCSPCVVPNTARQFAFLWTIFRPLHLQQPPSWLFLPSHTVLGSCLPSACLRATPLVVSAFLSGVPSPWCADTNDASRASCTPPKRDKPSAITSNLRESEFLCTIQVSPHYVGGAETAGEGHWQAEAAQQQHPERLRINSHDSVHWECCDRDGRHRTTLGSG